MHVLPRCFPLWLCWHVTPQTLQWRVGLPRMYCRRREFREYRAARKRRGDGRGAATPATPSCQSGWVVTVKNSTYPEDSEYAFQLVHISCAPRPATSDDLHRGRADLRVGQQIVDATVYVNVTDTMFELDSTAPRCLRAADICWTNVCHRTTSRQSRHTMHVVGKPRTYRRPPQHVYITQMMCDEINVTVEYWWSKYIYFGLCLLI